MPCHLRKICPVSDTPTPIPSRAFAESGPAHANLLKFVYNPKTHVVAIWNAANGGFGWSELMQEEYRYSVVSRAPSAKLCGHVASYNDLQFYPSLGHVCRSTTCCSCRKRHGNMCTPTCTTQSVAVTGAPINIFKVS